MKVSSKVSSNGVKTKSLMISEGSGRFLVNMPLYTNIYRYQGCIKEHKPIADQGLRPEKHTDYTGDYSPSGNIADKQKNIDKNRLTKKRSVMKSIGYGIRCLNNRQRHRLPIETRRDMGIPETREMARFQHLMGQNAYLKDIGNTPGMTPKMGAKSGDPGNFDRFSPLYATL